jgi:hypothetical protein
MGCNESKYLAPEEPRYIASANVPSDAFRVQEGEEMRKMRSTMEDMAALIKRQDEAIKKLSGEK